jgi:hypothetical protein
MIKLLGSIGLMAVLSTFYSCEKVLPKTNTEYKTFLNMPFIKAGVEFKYDYVFFDETGDSITTLYDYYNVVIDKKIGDNQFRIFQKFNKSSGTNVDTVFWVLTQSSWFECKFPNDTINAFRYYFSGTFNSVRISGDSTQTRVDNYPKKLKTVYGDILVHSAYRTQVNGIGNSSETYFIDQYRSIGILKVRQEQENGKYSEFRIRK